MKIINWFLFELIIILLISCAKENNSIDNQHVDYKYVVKIQNDQLISYSVYNNLQDSLLYEVTFDYQNDLVVEQKIKNSIKEYKIVYELIDGVAIESIDSIYNKGVLTELYHTKYYHTNGRLTSKEFSHSYIYDDTIILFNGVNKYYYSETGNINSCSIESNIGFGDYQCWDEYSYTDLHSLLDINCLNAKITGELSSNLIEKKTYNEGCPSGPSYIFPVSSYTYEINNSGYVTLSTETFISGYAKDTTVSVSKFDYIIE